MIEEPPVAAVLDEAGMVSFALRNAAVADLILAAAAQGSMVGVPSVALLAAHVAVRGDEVARARLAVLTALPAVRVLPMTAAEAARVAETGGGPLDAGRMHAAWAADEYAAYYVTTDRESAPSCLPSWQILDPSD